MDAQELLDALRKKLGTRYQGELAEALGVSLQTLTNWKNSDKKLSVEQIAGA
ncbi:TPA: helix-turn-helix domain-containing protein, partial [Pseudomonas aeruginosa]|nr:helix-turn-helix domain-containing protein [Pseudomonas aeruginosa]HEQ0175674.1 helix-turn-helix domain-containing protein [Pseudomonas aeruginosa]HEQ0194547.1 helix-turn-helix domain-containing protein [Pseudomonas aeruginosa]